jgi:hypothetical protein
MTLVKVPDNAGEGKLFNVIKRLRGFSGEAYFFVRAGEPVFESLCF